MRSRPWLVPLVVLAGCKRHPGPASSDAGSPVVEKEPVPVVTTAPDKLEVVATAQGLFSPTLRVFGTHVWLTSDGKDDLLADRDGPIAKTPPLLARLDFTGGLAAPGRGIDIVGVYPHLFALYALHGATRNAPIHAMAWTYQPVADKSGTWTKTKPLDLRFYPKAWLAFGDSALIVDSAADRSSNTGFSPSLYERKKAGSWAIRVAPDGTVADYPLGVGRELVAWSAAADARSLVLLAGTKPDDGGLGLIGVQSLRIDESMEPHRTELATGAQSADAAGARVRVHGRRTLVVPPTSSSRAAPWSPDLQTLFAVDEQGASKPIRMPIPAGETDCWVVDADFGGDDVFVLRTCDANRRSKELLRFRGAWQQIALPNFNNGTCTPDAFVLRQPDDLWVTAHCGMASTFSGTVLLRRGHPQTLVEVP